MVLYHEPHLLGSMSCLSLVSMSRKVIVDRIANPRTYLKRWAMTEHYRDIDNLLKKSGDETLVYKTFPAERGGQNSQWSIISSLGEAKPEAGPASQPQAFPEASQWAPEPSCGRADQQPSWGAEPDPQPAATQSGREVPSASQAGATQPRREASPTEGFGHLFRRTAEPVASADTPARGTPLKALLRRIAS